MNVFSNESANIMLLMPLSGMRNRKHTIGNIVTRSELMTETIISSMVMRLGRLRCEMLGRLLRNLKLYSKRFL